MISLLNVFATRFIRRPRLLDAVFWPTQLDLLEELKLLPQDFGIARSRPAYRDESFTFPAYIASGEHL